MEVFNFAAQFVCLFGGSDRGFDTLENGCIKQECEKTIWAIQAVVGRIKSSGALITDVVHGINNLKRARGEPLPEENDMYSANNFFRRNGMETTIASWDASWGKT
eukprot:6025367-Ditylum_brightwellii.AAC.2